MNKSYDLTLYKGRRYLKSKDVIHPLNIKLLKNFLDEFGNIKHRIFTRCNKQQQSKISKSIKQARELGLLSYGN